MDYGRYNKTQSTEIKWSIEKLNIDITNVT